MLLKLEPVKQPFIFEKINELYRTSVFKAHPIAYDFWSEFEFVELKENMRQKTDPIFAAMLDRIRVGCPTQEDVQLLQKQVIPFEFDDYENTKILDYLQIDNSIDNQKLVNAVRDFLEHIKIEPNTMTLLSHNETCEIFNKIVTHILNIKTVNIWAVDSNRVDHQFSVNEPNYGKGKKKKNKIKRKANETGGLEENLIMGVGSAVMLRRNLNLDKGLVNGAIGVVREIIFSDTHPDEVQKLLITFNGNEIPTCIDRVIVDYEYQKNVYISRTQFPLTLAWAISIHKCQGLTLNSVYLDLGAKIFQGGMAYVALSRSRYLNKVKLIQFDPTQLYCKIEAFNEYLRLYDVNNLSNLFFKQCNILPNNNRTYPQLNKKTTMVEKTQKQFNSKKGLSEKKLPGKIIDNN